MDYNLLADDDDLVDTDAFNDKLKWAWKIL